jgi:hypothetical protein
MGLPESPAAGGSATHERPLEARDQMGSWRNQAKVINDRMLREGKSTDRDSGFFAGAAGAICQCLLLPLGSTKTSAHLNSNQTRLSSQSGEIC